MSRRRLLVLCYFFPPLAGGGVHRVLGFTRHLPDHGWSCTVVCAGPGDYWVMDESLLARVPGGTEVVRVPGGSALSVWLRWRRDDRGRRSGRVFAGMRSLSDWMMVPDSYAGWSRRAVAAAAQLLSARGSGRASPAFDAVLSSSPPDSVHLAALDLRRRYRIPWVADFRDAWIGLAYREPPTAWHRALHRRMERDVLAAADVVVAASASHAAALGRRPGGGPRRLVHLPNGYEPESAGPLSAGRASPGTADAAGADDRFTLLFTGTLSLTPDTGVFLEAMHDLLARRPEARRRIRARLVGPFDSDDADRARALGLTGIVEFAGPVPHAEARALQRRAGLLLLWKPRRTPTMVPGKLYEYLDAGRPLVALLDPEDEAAGLVRRAGGAITPPGDRAALAAEIERHYLAWRDGTPVAASRPEWLDEHTRSRLAGRLAAELDGLAGEGT